MSELEFYSSNLTLQFFKLKLSHLALNLFFEERNVYEMLQIYGFFDKFIDFIPEKLRSTN